MNTQNAQLERYGGGETDDYSSDSDVYSDNISESESENCSDYGSEYESDTETIIKSPISQPPNIEKQISNSTNSTDQVNSTCSNYPATVLTKRQEKFDNKFTPKDLLNKIREIASSPARDMSIVFVFTVSGIHKMIDMNFGYRGFHPDTAVSMVFTDTVVNLYSKRKR